MERFIFLAIAFLILSGCTSLPMPQKGAVIVTAVPKSSDNTGWYRDFCTFGQPVNDEVISYGDSCKNNQVFIHAYINKVRLARVYDLNGGYYGNKYSAAMSGAQRLFWNTDNHEEELFILSRATQDFKTETGIDFLMTPVSYDQTAHCIRYASYYTHSDVRFCPDKEFHNNKWGYCYPVELLLKHFAND